MNKKNIIITIGAILILVGLYSGGSAIYGASVSQPAIITSAVWALSASTTAQVWSAMEVTYNGGLSINTRGSVSSTATRLLTQNSGRATGASVCNEGSVNGWIAFGQSVSTTSTDSNYFSTSTGKLVPAGTCYELSR